MGMGNSARSRPQSLSPCFHGNILVLTGGAFETNVIGLQVFLEAFGYLRFGSATALAWVLASLLIGFAVYQLNFLRKVEFRRAQ